MNYLAHIYLSGDNTGRMIGNFIADHVKGRMIEKYNDDIKAGIYLHRKIDQYTDTHPMVERSKARLRLHFHKYAPVIVDVFYDHFLASNWSEYHPDPLEEYCQNIYSTLKSNNDLLPERTSVMLDYMIRQNWLYNYRLTEGIDRSLTGMSKRTTFNSGMENATIQLVSEYDSFSEEFRSFFADLKQFVAENLG